MSLFDSHNKHYTDKTNELINKFSKLNNQCPLIIKKSQFNVILPYYVKLKKIYNTIEVEKKFSEKNNFSIEGLKKIQGVYMLFGHITDQMKQIKSISYDQLHFVFLSDSEIRYDEFIYHLIKRTICFKKFITELGFKFPEKLTIYCCLNEGDRELPTQISSLREKDFKLLEEEGRGLTVSGATFFPSKNIPENVILTKKEEMHKLLIHELCHAIGIDKNDKEDIIEINSKWSTHNSKLNLSETIAEFVGVILHSMFNTLEINTKLNDEELLLNYLFYEYHYSFYFVCKLLKLYGYDEDNLEKFFSPGKKLNQPLALWEYVFLRTIAFFDFPTTAKLIFDRNSLINFIDRIKEISIPGTDLFDNFIKQLKCYFQFNQNSSDRSMKFILVELNYNQK